MSTTIAVSRTEHNQLGGMALKLRAKGSGGGRALLQRIMSTHGEPRKASGGRLIAQRMAQTQPRYRIGDGQGRYLSIDGSCVVSCSRSGWFGTAEQAEKALQCFPAAAGMRPLRSIESKLPHLSTVRCLWGPE